MKDFESITNKLEFYWHDIPVGKENAIRYPELMLMWGVKERDVRQILHELSSFDNGDDYILIRSAKNRGGFYKTTDVDEIKAFKKECLAKGKSNFAPVKKINRVMRNDAEQISMTNNLRVMREAAGLKQSEVCVNMKQFDEAFDVPMLSKMENGVCLPTFYQCKKLAEMYGCNPSDLIRYDVFLA